jgi:hypothetical protein
VNFPAGNVLELSGERADMISVGRASFRGRHIIVEDRKKPDGVRRVIDKFVWSIDSVCTQVNQECEDKSNDWF